MRYPLTFRATELLIGRQVQAALDLGPIQHGVVFASCHERKACQISTDGSHTILPIQPHQGTFLRELVRLQIALNGGHCPTQFLPVVTVPWVAEAAEPLMGLGAARTVLRVRTTSPRWRPV